MFSGVLSAETAEDLRIRARHAIRGGYEQPSTVVDDLVELIEYDPATEELVRSDRAAAVSEVTSIVHDEDSQYLAEAATWPPETDCDRLAIVFAELERSGIVARENVGYTQSDLRDELSEVVTDLLKAGRSIRGWVGFHGQDLERAVDGGGLHLGFAPAQSSKEAAWVEVGTEIVETFRKAGFTIEWSGSSNQRPLLKAINWRRRRH
jgi:hypothetical protein